MGIDAGAFSNSLIRGLSVGQGLVLNGQNQGRQQKLDAQREEDRQFTRQLQETSEKRQQELYEMQKTRYDKQEKIDEGLRIIAGMEASLENGTYDTPEFYAMGNQLFGDMIQVGGPEGAQKEWAGAVMTQGGFIPQIKVTRADGSSYTAPATLPNRDENDKDVMVIPVRDFLMEMGNRKIVLNRLHTEYAKLNPKGYLENKQTVAAEERKSAAGLAKEERENAFDLQKMDKEYSLKRGLEAAKTKSGASGKTDLIQLKTGRTSTLDDLRKSYIASYGKSDGLGNLIGTIDGAPNYNDWVNQQAVEPVFWEDPERESDEIAEEEPAKKKRRGQVSAAIQGIDLKKAAMNAVPFLRPTTAAIDAMRGKETQTHAAVQGLGPQQKPQATIKRRSLDDIFQPGGQPSQKLDQSNAEHVKIAREILDEAKGDKALARQIAQQRGYSF